LRPVAVVQTDETEHTEPFEALPEAFAARSLEAFKLSEPMTWRKLEGSTPRCISQIVEGQAPGEEGRIRMQWAMVQVDETHLVLINFTHESKPEDEKALSEAAQRMVESVRVSE
jgi:hypothetical protein